MRWYFSGASLAPCLAAHSWHLASALSISLQFSSIDLLDVTMLVSSTKPTAKVGPSRNRGTTPDAKKRNRTADRVEPCGVLVAVFLWVPWKFLRISDVVRLVRNEPIKRMATGGDLYPGGWEVVLGGRLCRMLQRYRGRAWMQRGPCPSSRSYVLVR